MSLNITDLKPKNFKVVIKGVELECKPLRLSHTLTISKIGNVFQNPKEFNNNDIKQAEKEMDVVISELIPELKDIELDAMTIMDLITQMMEQIQPSDNKFLNDNGVDLNSDPKVERAG